MRFYFDIDAEELNDEYSPSFIELIKMRCADGLREEVWDSITRDGTYETLIDASRGHWEKLWIDASNRTEEEASA